MRRPRPIPAFLGFLALTGPLTAALAADPPKLPETFEPAAVDAYLDGLAREKGYPGLAVAVVRDGKVALAKGYGRRSLPDGPPVTADTPFAVGSVTKQFTCAAVFLLAEDGKLSVDDKVSTYFSGLTRAKDITLYDLMSHAAGYPDYYPLDFVDRRMLRPTAVDDVLSKYAGGALDFEPGARWSYSNTGFLLLGRVVEKVSGETLGAFLKRRVFDPLGMTRATFGDPGPDRATGYTSFALGPPEPATPEAAGWLEGAGGLWASVNDLAKWDLGLMSGKVLRPESLRRMTTPRELAGGRLKDYGCGLHVDSVAGLKVLSHGGAVSGFHSNNVLIPGPKSAVVVLANCEYQSPGEVGSSLMGLLLKGENLAGVPKVDGPSPEEAGKSFLRQMQEGKVDRSRLGEEFSAFLTEDRLRGAAARLKPLGEVQSVNLTGLYERGGLEVAGLRFRFEKEVLRGLLYRSPDGKVQQLLFTRE